MKTIQNKSTTIETGTTNEAGGIEFLNYAALMKTVMAQRKPDGYSIDDMRKDLRVLDALLRDSGDFKLGEISLEDADFDHFKSKMRTMRWGAVHKDLIQFDDDINAIK